MSLEEIVKSWKDPEHRRGGDHPSGEIALAAGPDTATTSFMTIVGCTYDSLCGTWWGTCAMDTYGCCVPPPPY